MYRNKATFLSIVFKLMERGLSGDQIDAAMREMVGNDWREISVSTWLARLQDKNYIREIDPNLYLEQLEMLIKHRTSTVTVDHSTSRAPAIDPRS